MPQSAMSSEPVDPFLTSQHLRLRQQVRDFAATVIAPRVPDMESRPADIETELPQRIAEQGWFGVTIDPAYGGMGAGHLAKTVILEELSRVSAATGAMAQAAMLGAAKVIHFGSAEQQHAWLPRFADGSCLPSIAVTEEGCGGHVLGMAATGRRDGDHFVLNGEKVFIGNSHISHVHGVVVRTGPGSGGLSAFLVEADRPGLSLHPHPEAVGWRGFSFGDLTMADCRVPVGNLIGDLGDGLKIAYSSSILYGRLNLAAVALGVHQAVMEQTLAVARERCRYGRPLAEVPDVRRKIGEMYRRLRTARVLAYHAAHQLDHHPRHDIDLFNTKYTAVELLLDSARAGMEIHAAAGLRADSPMQRLLRDAHPAYAPAGTSDVQIHRLAEIVLGADAHDPWSQQLAHLLSPAGVPARGQDGSSIPQSTGIGTS